jgi:hypothetical protein
MRRQKVLDRMVASFNLLLISSWIKFWFVTVVSKYLDCDTFSNDMFAIFTSLFWPTFWWRDIKIYLVFADPQSKNNNSVLYAPTYWSSQLEIPPPFTSTETYGTALIVSPLRWRLWILLWASDFAKRWLLLEQSFWWLISFHLHIIIPTSSCINKRAFLLSVFLCVLTHIAHRGTLMHGMFEAIGTNYSFSRWRTSAVIRLEEQRVSSSETQYGGCILFSPSHSIRNVSIFHFNYFHHHRGPYSLLQHHHIILNTINTYVS